MSALVSPSEQPLPAAPSNPALLQWSQHGDSPAVWGRWLLGLGLLVMGFGCGVSVVVITAGLGIAVIGAGMSRWPILRTPAMLPMILFALWVAISGLVAGDDESLLQGLSWRWLGLTLGIAGPLIPAVRQRFPLLLGIGMGLGAVLGILQFLIGYDVNYKPLRLHPDAPNLAQARASGFFGLHLTQGMLCAMVLLWFSTHHHRGPSTRAWVIRILVFAGLVVSQARSAFLGFLAGVATRLSVRGVKGTLIAGATVLCLGAIAVGAIAIANPELLARSTGLKDSRWTIWQISGDIAKEHWAMGTGGKNRFREEYRERLAVVNPKAMTVFDPENPEAAFAVFPHLREDPEIAQHLRDLAITNDPAYRERLHEALVFLFDLKSGNTALFPKGAPHAHNTFLGLLTFHGVPALVLFLLTLGVLAAYFWRHRRDTGGLGLGLIVTAIIAGQFEYFAGDAESGMIFWLLIGWCLGEIQLKGASASSAESDEGSLQNQ